MAEYTPDEETVREQYSREQPPHIGTVGEKRAEFDRFLARVRRDAWDACHHQMVTAPARGVTVVPQSNPYAPERRESP